MVIVEKNDLSQTSSKKDGEKLDLSQNKFIFLKATHLQEITNWSFSYLNQKLVAFNDRFPQVKIGTFLSRSKYPVKIQDDEFYKQVTIRLYGKGAKVRDGSPLQGKEIKTKTQFLVKEGQFLFSRIDARNGAFAIAGREIAGAVVTNDFPVYDIDTDFVNPNYFSLLISTDQFADYFQGLSSGTTNRQRMNETDFLEYKIPLPPLKIQNKLIDNYNDKISQAEADERQTKDLEKKIEEYLFKRLDIKIQKKKKKSWNGFTVLQPAYLKDLNRWNVNYLLNKKFDENSFNTKFQTHKLSEITKSIGGGTPSKTKREFWNGNIPWVSPKDMKTDFISETQDYISELAVKFSAVSLIDSGHLIFVMRSGILQHTVPVAINERVVTINQDLRAFKVTNKTVRTIYLLRYFQYTQPLLLKLVKTGTTVQSIDLKRLEELKIPIPPLEVQDEIVEHINAKKDEINQLKYRARDLRNNAKIEFEAELFKG